MGRYKGLKGPPGHFCVNTPTSSQTPGGHPLFVFGCKLEAGSDQACGNRTPDLQSAPLTGLTWVGHLTKYITQLPNEVSLGKEGLRPHCLSSGVQVDRLLEPQGSLWE
ncbi:hypothetical protein Bbelb_015310 [Branchiostoma belcheri]|nr:hypothetical protein Bbelb_015310 [Branchiostoma belcheri]